METPSPFETAIALITGYGEGVDDDVIVGIVHEALVSADDDYLMKLLATLVGISVSLAEAVAELKDAPLSLVIQNIRNDGPPRSRPA